jgi:hypothetical protein
MTTMTESQMEDHIKSNPWNYVNTKRRGSSDYDSHIGILRVMFSMQDDPSEIHTLLSEDKTEVWARFSEDWQRLFAC